MSRYALLPLLLVTLALAACGEETVAPESAAPSAVEGPALQAAVSGSPSDLAAMEEIVATFDQSWGNDAVTYAGQYAGAEWVGPTGVIQTDPAIITAIYAGLFAGPFAGTVRQSTIRSLIFLTGTIAVLNIDARVTVPWQVDPLHALEKNILVKRAGEWQIVQHQQTIVAPT